MAKDELTLNGEPKHLSQFPRPEVSPGFLLWHATNRWQKKQRNALKEYGLTHVQFVLLAGTWWLNKHQEHVNQRQIANFGQCDMMMTSQVLRTLEKKGFITRSLNERDSRSYDIRLTDNGHSMVEKTLPVIEQVDNEFFSRAGHSKDLITKILQDLSGIA